MCRKTPTIYRWYQSVNSLALNVAIHKNLCQFNSRHFTVSDQYYDINVSKWCFNILKHGKVPTVANTLSYLLCNESRESLSEFVQQEDNKPFILHIVSVVGAAVQMSLARLCKQTTISLTLTITH